MRQLDDARSVSVAMGGMKSSLTAAAAMRYGARPPASLCGRAVQHGLYGFFPF
jgi:hypothetical protein